VRKNIEIIIIILEKEDEESCPNYRESELVRFYFIIIIHPATEGHETETLGKGRPGEEFLSLFFFSYYSVSL
jgi:hypothetical protein